MHDLKKKPQNNTVVFKSQSNDANLLIGPVGSVCHVPTNIPNIFKCNCKMTTRSCKLFWTWSLRGKYKFQALKDPDSFTHSQTRSSTHTQTLFSLSEPRQTRVMSLGEFPYCHLHHRHGFDRYALCVCLVCNLLYRVCFDAVKRSSVYTQSPLKLINKQNAAEREKKNLMCGDLFTWRQRESDCFCDRVLMKTETEVLCVLESGCELTLSLCGRGRTRPRRIRLCSPSPRGRADVAGRARSLSPGKHGPSPYRHSSGSVRRHVKFNSFVWTKLKLTQLFAERLVPPPHPTSLTCRLGYVLLLSELFSPGMLPAERPSHLYLKRIPLCLGCSKIWTAGSGTEMRKECFFFLWVALLRRLTLQDGCRTLGKKTTLNTVIVLEYCIEDTSCNWLHFYKCSKVVIHSVANYWMHRQLHWFGLNFETVVQDIYH